MALPSSRHHANSIHRRACRPRSSWDFNPSSYSLWATCNASWDPEDRQLFMLRLRWWYWYSQLWGHRTAIVGWRGWRTIRLGIPGGGVGNTYTIFFFSFVVPRNFLPNRSAPSRMSFCIKLFLPSRVCIRKSVVNHCTSKIQRQVELWVSTFSGLSAWIDVWSQ